MWPSCVRKVPGNFWRKSAEASEAALAGERSVAAAGDEAERDDACGGWVVAAPPCSRTLASSAVFLRIDSGQTTNGVPLRISRTLAPCALPRSVGTHPLTYFSIQPS